MKLFHKHDYPYAWKFEKEYKLIDAPNIVQKRYYKECKCGKRKYYDGPFGWSD